MISPSSKYSTVGGGDSYTNKVRPGDADYTVSTKSGLQNALNGASSGEVVYVDGDADIDMGESKYTIPSGVTLASDRGVNGAPGGRVYSNGSPWGILSMQDGSRISGLRVEGPRTDWYTRGELEHGIEVAGTDCEVDNCEVYNWGWACVRCAGTSNNTHVHHCDIYGGYESGSGYGVATTSSNYTLIEWNHFADCRHATESTDGSKTVRNNHVTGEAISHIFDQHPSGHRVEVYNNTVEPVQQADDNKKAPAVAIRDVPTEIAEIHHNWFFNPEEPLTNPNGWTDEAIIQVHVSEWTNVQFWDNHYGDTEPSDPSVGVQEDTQECSVDADCPTGYRCNNGTCEPIPDNDYDHYLEIRTSSDAPSNTTYTFTTTGHIKEGNQTELADNDDITENNDGSWTASGTTGGGFSDDYYFMGEATDFSCNQPSEYWTLVLDGAIVSSAEFTGEDTSGGDGGGGGDTIDGNDGQPFAGDEDRLSTVRIGDFALGPEPVGDITVGAQMTTSATTTLLPHIDVALAGRLIGTSDSFAATTGGAFVSTAGGSRPGAAGYPTLRPEAQLPLSTVDGDYALTLVRDDGEPSDDVVIEGDDLDIDFVNQLMPVRTHSSVSDWSLRVPYGAGGADEDLLDWVRARVYLTRDNQMVFVGRLRRVDPQASKGHVSLEGTDMGGDLRSGSTTFQTEEVHAFEAIRECWDAVAPGWDVAVTRPAPGEQTPVDHWPGRRYDDGFEGSPLRILQKIHEDLGFRFVIDRKRPHRAVSFRAGDVVLPQLWTPIETSPMRDIGGYYNHAIVKGAVDDETNQRVEGEYRAEDEIQHLMDEHGMTEEQATETWSETDPELTTDWGCRQRAEMRVEEGVANDSVTAQVACQPTLIPPGPSYTVEELDNDRREGAWSLRFNGEHGSYVELPTDAWKSITPNGTITFWVRPAEGIRPLIPVIGSQTQSMRVGWAGRSLTLHVTSADESDKVRVHAYPNADVPLGEWSFVHYDWSYDEENDRTFIRAGRNDEGITDTAVLDGQPRRPTQRWWFGRMVASRFEGNIDNVCFWEGTLDVDKREQMYNGEWVSGPIRHRWPFRNPPTAPRATIYDVVGKQHGETADEPEVEYDGNPFTIETVDFRESKGNATGTLNFSDSYNMADELHRVRERTDRSERFV